MDEAQIDSPLFLYKRYFPFVLLSKDACDNTFCFTAHLLVALLTNPQLAFISILLTKGYFLTICE